MSKSRTGLYLGLGAAGLGGYYLYRAGGNPKAGKEEMKYDSNRARAKAPGTEQAERAGEKVGLETNLNIDEAANNPRTQNTDLTSESLRKLDQLSKEGQETASRVRSEVEAQASKMKGEVEEKASEAKSTVSGWFGGKK